MRNIRFSNAYYYDILKIDKFQVLGDIFMKYSHIKYFTALLMFGLNGIIASHIGLSSYEIVLLRTLLGSLLLISLFWGTKQKFKCMTYKKDLLFIVVSGIAMGISWMCLYEAYAQIGVSIASLLYYTGPMIIMILSPLLFKEKMTIIKIVSFVVVLAGIFLVNGTVFNEISNPFGIFFGILSAVMYSIMVMSNKKTRHIKGFENSLIQLTVSFFTVLIFAYFKNGLSIHIDACDWIWILILGFINTGIGCYFYFSSIGNLPIQTVAICGYIEPLSAVLFSIILLHEKMLPIQIVGAIFIIGGAVFGECFHMKDKK